MFHTGGDATMLLSKMRKLGTDKIISRLKALNVHQVRPCHCSEDIERELFRMAWGENFLYREAGRV